MDRNENKRKLATAREKRRMEKLNHCIEDLRVMICPAMKGRFSYGGGHCKKGKTEKNRTFFQSSR